MTTYFCIRFPETVDGSVLADQFETYAAEGMDNGYKVRIAHDRILDYDGIWENAQDPDWLAKLEAANEIDAQNVAAYQAGGIPMSGPSLMAPNMFLQYKPGIEARVSTKRTNSVKDFFLPLKTTFRIDPDKPYRSLNEYSGREYTDAHIADFEPFAEQLYEDLGFDLDAIETKVTEDIYHGEDADPVGEDWGLTMGSPRFGRDLL